MATRKSKPGRAIAVVAQPTLPSVIALGRHEVTVEAVYRDREIHPVTPGPWADEADKVAWIDPIEKLGCIIRRNERDGHLGGYVGVGPEHPLFGWSDQALRGLGLVVHGGIRYAAECMHWERESRSICHTTVDAGPTHTAVHSRNAHDDQWWIGFECDQPYDAVPNPRYHDGPDTLAGSVTVEYRDQGYVYEQCRSLASQLAAIGRGEDPSTAALLQPPAIGSDPRRGVAL